MIIILFEDVNEVDVGRNKESAAPAVKNAAQENQHRSAFSWISKIWQKVRRIFDDETISSEDDALVKEKKATSLEDCQPLALTELNG